MTPLDLVIWALAGAAALLLLGLGTAGAIGMIRNVLTKKAPADD